MTRHTLDLARQSASQDRPGPLAYVGLTLCRALCLVDTGRQVSKAAAAGWLLEREPWASNAIDACRHVVASHGREPLAPADEAPVRRLIAKLGDALEARLPTS